MLVRDSWDDRPQRLSPAWTLHKGDKRAECVVWSHVLGWELRLTVGAELLQSQVCRSQDELIATQEQWHAAMLEKAWPDRTVKIDDFPADAWICEQHPDQPWPHPNPDEPDGQCAGPGMLRSATPPQLLSDVDQRHPLAIVKTARNT